ncbi:MULTISPECIES: chemotaxis-specific protein-glutamate methyltransferase CheB [Rhodopseudomonas]|uniref:Protein-glutamate methylesterase/protein-glutamine glutaminase n=1 Tax=Rhodopseudomonas palustris TaxID=1076 RepID=A0A0D7DW63_RHOPL|nr:MULTISPECIES: chemotaxis-specific protein-glutamate methyltransferase CheB [Rhodopseudomonas]KIZ32783.1 chemotaxis protein CheY [Rhodopseudomonas palustris]MDF3809089.1 chemotaxis-specific protein-glutamate methyltransferase CheB [Rhodopseudomonas sp. BAL398]WOK16408.1 chemotaxis-specific protein-glutamate methyltransferase CheB [Rhodopseudomonas sp. BAL398]
MINLLIVDDSALVRKLLGQVFAAQGDFQVAFARSGKEALAAIAVAVPDVVTLDVHMPDLDGLQCLDRIMIEHPCPVIMVSSMTADGADATLEALRLGAVDFVAKPTGAVSLRIDELAAELVAKVRQAAGAKLRPSLRLRERVRHRISNAPRLPASRQKTSPDISPAIGEGIVLVGTSTGGPPALEALLTRLPADFPWPIVVAQHMPATFTGSLARRLDGICQVSVVEVAAVTALQPGHVYIGRGDADIIISRRKAALVAMPAPAEVYPWHPSTDRLVRSAMNQIDAGQLLGILMTGMGNDGAEAMSILRSKGGRTIAEAEETAVVWGMPGELVKAGGADFVTPLPEIAAQLLKLVPPCL